MRFKECTISTQWLCINRLWCCGCLFCCLFLARATESWRGGFYCMFPAMVMWFVVLIEAHLCGWSSFFTGRPWKLYSFAVVSGCLYLVTWLKALGTSRKKKSAASKCTYQTTIWRHSQIVDFFLRAPFGQYGPVAALY